MPRRAAGFEVSAISLEKGQGSDGLYAVGTVVNTSNRPRSGVTVELDLLDAGGQKVGIARAYRPVLAPGAKWEFKVARAGRCQSRFRQAGFDQRRAVSAARSKLAQGGGDGQAGAAEGGEAGRQSDR